MNYARAFIVFALFFLCAALRAQQPAVAPDSSSDSVAVGDSLSMEQDTAYYDDSTDEINDSLYDYEDNSFDSLHTVSLQHATCSLGVVFGVAAANASDVVSYINQNAGGNMISGGLFATAAAISSSFTCYVSQYFDAAVEYSFLTNAYQFQDPNINGYNFSYDVHRFTVMVHRLINRDFYGMAVGAGVGYTIGYFRQTTPAAPNGVGYRASGGNVAAEIILRSAFGGHIYFHIDLQGFVAFTGALSNNGTLLHIGTPPAQNNITLNSFGGSAGVGLDYFF